MPSPPGAGRPRRAQRRLFGDRNAPPATYAAQTPAFRRNANGAWIGGQFLDGRAAMRADRAGGPPLPPAEMGMPDEAAVVARLRERPVSRRAFPAICGTGLRADVSAACRAMTEAIAALVRTDLFAPFGSKYDRWLRGEAALTRNEEPHVSCSSRSSSRTAPNATCSRPVRWTRARSSPTAATTTSERPGTLTSAR